MLPDRVKRKRLIALGVLGVLVLAGIGLFGLYQYRLHRITEHVRSLKPAGLEAFEAGEHRDALTKLGSYLQRWPDDREALAAYAEARMNTPEVDGRHLVQAIGVYRRLLELGGDDATRRKLLDLYVEVGFDAEAKQLADRLLEKDADDEQALRAKAISTARMREHATAIEVAERYLDLQPEDVEVQFVRLSAMQQRGDGVEQVTVAAGRAADAMQHPGRSAWILAYARQLAGDRASATRLYLDAADQLAGEPEAVGQIAQSLDRIGAVREATQLLSRVAQQTRDRYIEQLLTRRLWEQQRVDELLPLARRLAENAQQSVATSETAATLALTLIQTGSPDEAAPIITLLERRGGDTVAQAWTPVLKALSRGDEADSTALRSAVELALARQSNHPIFRSLYGDLLFRTGETERAVAAWQQAAYAAPAWPNPLLRISRVMLSTQRPLLAFIFAQQASLRAPERGDVIMTLLEAVEPNLDRLQPEGLQQIRTMLGQVEASGQMPVRLVPLMTELDARDGQPAVAADRIRAALQKTDEADRDTLLRLAAVSAKHDLGLVEEILAAYRAAFGVEPRLAYAEALHQAVIGDPQQALATFREAMAAAPEGAEDAHQWRVAEAQLMERIEPDKAATAWQALIKAHPDRREILQLAADARSVQRDRAALESVVAGLKTTAGEDSTTYRIARARLLLSGNPDERVLAEATTLLLDVVQSMPYLIEPNLLLASALERLGNTDRAIAALEQAQRLAPDSVDLMLDRARLIQSVGDTQRAGNLIEAAQLSDSMTLTQRRKLAQLVFERGNVTMARQLLRSALEEDPQHQPTMLLLAAAETRLGNDAAADELYQSLLVQPDLRALQSAAVFYHRQGDFQQVDELLARLDAVAGSPGEAAMTRGAFYAGRGDLDRARQEFRKATQDGASAQAAWTRLLLVAIESGQADEAQQVVRDAAAALPQDRTFARLVGQLDVLRLGAEQPTLRPLLATVITGGDYSDPALRALQILRDGEKQQRQTADVIVEMRRLADVHRAYTPLQMLTARLYLSAGRTLEAAEIAQRAMRSSPNDAGAAQLAAETLLAADRLVEARTAAIDWRARSGENTLPADLFIAQLALRDRRPADAVRQLEPYLDKPLADNVQAAMLQTLGRAYVQSGQPDRVHALLDAKLSESAAHRAVMIGLASLSITTADDVEHWLETVAPHAATPAERLGIAQAYRAADERLREPRLTKRAIELLSAIEGEPAVVAAAQQTLGMIAEAEGRLDEAERYYRAALAGNADLALANNNLAMVLLQGGHPAEAAGHARRANDLAPRVAAFRDTLALVLAANQQFDEAKTAAQQAVALEPRNPEFYLTLGEVLVQANELDQARELLAQVEQAITNPAGLPAPLQQRLEKLRQQLGGAAAPAATDPLSLAPALQ